MTAGVLIGAVCLMSLLLWAVVLAWRSPPWRRREHLEPREMGGALTDVDVIVPARNEAHVLPRTLSALLRQGAGVRVFVVDDESTDGTARAADPGGLVRVIHGRPRPPGWSGKLWALEQGRACVSRPYTLLLDADVQLEPGMVESLRQHLEHGGHGLVSVLARPQLQSAAERLLMPAYAFFFELLYPFRRANDPASRVAAAGGGCLLIRTDLVTALDPFRQIRGELIDDCALARLVKASGASTWIGLTHGAASIRDSGGFAGIRDLVARHAYTQLGYSPALLGLVTLVMIVMFPLPPLATVTLPGAAGWLGLGTWTLMAVCYLPILRYYRCSPPWAALLPVIGALYLTMVWSSAWRYHLRAERASWRGRTYLAGSAR